MSKQRSEGKSKEQEEDGAVNIVGLSDSCCLEERRLVFCGSRVHAWQCYVSVDFLTVQAHLSIESPNLSVQDPNPISSTPYMIN